MNSFKRPLIASLSGATVKVRVLVGSALSSEIDTPSTTALKSLSSRSTRNPSTSATALLPTTMLFVLCATPALSGPVPSMVSAAIALLTLVMRKSWPVSLAAITSCQLGLAVVPALTTEAVTAPAVTVLICEAIALSDEVAAVVVVA
jgi:hypothetical protein